MITVVFVLAMLSLLLTIGNAVWRIPLWVPVLLLAIIELSRVMPSR